MRDNTCAAPDCERPATQGRWCTTHKHRVRLFGQFDLPPVHTVVQTICVIEGCTQAPARKHMCIMHWARITRWGSPERHRQARDRTRHTHGYVILHRPGHPLSVANKVFEHRYVLYEKVGYGPHLCHHCGIHINWFAGLECDHLDRDRANNDPANLVPTCHPCNVRRAIHRNQHSPPLAG